MALYRACVAYEQPTESTHCLNLGTRREEDQRSAKGEMGKNFRRRTEAEDGFRHLEQICYWCKRQSGLEETSQGLYSPRGDLGNKSLLTPFGQALRALASTCDDLRSLWSRSTLHASQVKFFTVWPPNLSQRKLGGVH